jgi:hypothetical protein
MTRWGPALRVASIAGHGTRHRFGTRMVVPRPLGKYRALDGQDPERHITAFFEIMYIVAELELISRTWSSGRAVDVQERSH